MALQFLAGPLNLGLGLLGCLGRLLLQEFFELFLRLVQITFEFSFLLGNKCLEFLLLLGQRVLYELLNFYRWGGRLDRRFCRLGQIIHAF